MPSTRHDIYGTGIARHRREPLSSAGARRAEEEYGKKSLKQKRRQSYILGASAFLITCLLVLVTFQQYLLNSAAPKYEPEPPTIAQSPAASRNIMHYLSLDTNAQTRFMLEEIQEQNLGGADIATGDKPLHAHWVKEASYHLLRAERAMREGMENEALNSYENALRIYPDLRGVYAAIGMLYMDRRDYQSAAAALERAALEEALSFGIANNLGVVYLHLEQYERAEQNLVLALRLSPEYAAAHFNLASLYVRMGHIEDAAKHCRLFLELEPDNLSALLVYASVLIQREEWEEAANILERAAVWSPQSPPIFFRLAQSLAQTNRPDEAMHALHRAVALVDSRNALAWVSRQEFDRLRGTPEFQRLADQLGTTW